MKKKPPTCGDCKWADITIVMDGWINCACPVPVCALNAIPSHFDGKTFAEEDARNCKCFEARAI